MAYNRLNTPSSMPSLTGGYGYSSDGSSATNANIGYSQAMAIDASNNSYITDLSVQCVREMYK